MLSHGCKVNAKGHLEISGCDAVELAQQYGTPLYVMNEDEIRSACQRYRSSFERYYQGNGKPIYASKAFSCKEIYRIVVQEGLDVEVVSGGELYTALQAGVDPKHIHFQGNNKTPGELAYAVESGVGDIVADHMEEIRQLQQLALENNVTVAVSLRIKPGIDAHTHDFIRTGQIDSKFGMDLANGEAMEAIRLTLACDNLLLTGLHCHIGSQILEIQPFVHAAQVMLDFYGQIKDTLGITFAALNLGGGFGISYTEQDQAVPYEDFMRDVSAVVQERCKELGLDTPFIYLEPGRSIVGEAGTTLYRVGAIREIPDVRNYVSVDGGMFDNPRYALYQAEYTCLLANKADRPADYTATIAGKCCESGDLIQEHTCLQAPEQGDLLAVLCTGAYNYSMSSNYNRNCKPSCVMVSQGESRIVIKGETYEDLVRNDV